MIYVVDASVAAKWFLNEPLEQEAKRLLDNPPQLQAPDWILQEVAHTAYKKWREHHIGAEHARTMVRALPTLLSEVHPSAALVDHALSLALTLSHPVYDCLYLACAEAIDGTVVTADDEFVEAVGKTPFAARVRHLAEVVA